MNIIDNKKVFCNQGFALIEVLVAIGVLTIGVISLYTMQVSTVQTNATANLMAMSTNWASGRIEILLSKPYNHSDLEDDNTDGTNQDANNDGIDDTGGNSIDYIGGIVVGGNVVDNAGGNFGLNDGLIFNNVTGMLTGFNQALADGRATSPDNRYTILWNVAVDTPVPNSKTIRVIVISQERGITQAVPLTYIKSERI
jgi:prepilin-type N-terminal cleavage/methylation domain-containing protein